MYLSNFAIIILHPARVQYYTLLVIPNSVQTKKLDMLTPLIARVVNGLSWTNYGGIEKCFRKLTLFKEIIAEDNVHTQETNASEEHKFTNDDATGNEAYKLCSPTDHGKTLNIGEKVKCLLNSGFSPSHSYYGRPCKLGKGVNLGIWSTWIRYLSSCNAIVKGSKLISNLSMQHNRRLEECQRRSQLFRPWRSQKPTQ